MEPDFKNMPRAEVEAYIRQGKERERKRVRNRMIALATLAAVAVWGVSMRISEWQEESAQAEANPVQILAPVLWHEFNTNERAANGRYEDAYLLVSGEIAEVGGAMRRGLMYLVGSGKALNEKVRVQLRSSNVEETVDLRPGNRVVISCKGCSMAFGYPALSSCKVVKVEG